ncbi:hypothetical protein ACT7CU_03380 [Bacillus paranthracis]
MTNSKEVTETVETQHTWQDHLFPDNPKKTQTSRTINERMC